MENTDKEALVFEVLRNGDTETLTVESPWGQDVLDNQGLPKVDSMVGINPTTEFKFFKSLGYGFTGIKNSSTMIFDTLHLLFSSNQVGAGDLAGPVGIYQITSSALEGGFINLLGWIGLLSVNLGVINLLPIPALDGGRLVFLGWEAITGKKPNAKVENTIHYVMYLALLGLFVFITYNDILRLFGLK
jgi:regulator of sigma E protease